MANSYDKSVAETLREMKKHNVHKHERIIYVEPNDVSDQNAYNNGNVPVTPDYTDMCISVDLICEKVSRMATNNGNVGQSNTNVVILSWNSNVRQTSSDGNGNSSVNPGATHFSFFHGSKEGNPNNNPMLTTYYTDIHYNDIRKNAQIEGMGIESINITYESWFTPTIKVRFVDVRGAAMFGREEVIHSNETENVTADSLFGVFMTLPYPKFRMQIKGFLGRAITYQLTCTDFRGQYNMRTGNFELDVTFVGYDYGMLCDIPMSYLVAAPYCNYQGSSYWNRKRLSKEWQLADGRAPIPLYDLMQDIGNAMKVMSKNTDNTNNKDYSTEEVQVSVAGTDATTEYTNAKDKESHLLKMQTNYGNCINNLKKSFDFYAYERGVEFNWHFFLNFNVQDYDNVREVEKILKQDNEELPLGFKWVINKTIATQNTFVAAERSFDSVVNGTLKYATFDSYIPSVHTVNHYKGRYTRSKEIPVSQINDAPKSNGTMAVKSLLGGAAAYAGTYKNIGTPVNNQQNFLTFLKNNNDLLVSYEFETHNKGRVKFYALCDFGFEQKLKEELDNVREIIKKYEGATSSPNMSNQDAMDEKLRLMAIEELVGTKPYIGNVFKIVMCHLETFLYIMNFCADIVEDQMSANKRNRKALGISDFDDTDIIVEGIDKTQDIAVGPFPGVTSVTRQPGAEQNGTGTMDDPVDDNIKSQTWVGDFGKPDTIVWEEEKLVLNLLLALKRMRRDSEEEPSEQLVPMAYPIIPSDLRHSNVPPSALTDTDSLAGWLGLRAAAIFGVSYPDCSDSDATTLGRMDAFNFAQTLGSSYTIKEYTDALGSNDKTRDTIGIITCSPDGDNYGEQNQSTGAKKHRHELTDNNVGSTDGRHRILDSDGSYVYTVTSINDATYDKKALIPIALDRYEEVRGKEDSTNNIIVSYDNPIKVKPKLTGQKGYRFLHTSKSASILSPRAGFKNTDLQQYENPDMFSVIVDASDGDDMCRADNIESLYDRLKEGKVYVVGYTEDLPAIKTAVLDKIWHIEDSDVGVYYKGSSHCLMPPVTEDSGIKIVNYVEGNLPENAYVLAPSEPLDEFSSDVNWYINMAWESKYNDYATKYDPAGNTWNIGDKKYDISTLNFRGSALRITFNAGTYYLSNLFGSPLYYAQNEIDISGINIPAYGKNYSNGDLRSMSKCLLFLHTLEYNMGVKPLFLSAPRGSITSLPYGYVLLLGGLLWRRLINVHLNNTDIIRTPKSISTDMPDPVNETLLCDANNIYTLCWSINHSGQRFVPISRFLDVDNLEPYVTNVLLGTFETFARGKWQTIEKDLELKNSNGNMLTSEGFLELMEKVCHVTAGQDVTSKRAQILSHLKENVKGFFGNYSSMVRKSLNGIDYVDLLYNANAAVQATLKDVYTRKVLVLHALSPQQLSGNGKVKIQMSTLRSYLNGFWDAVDAIRGNEAQTSGIVGYDRSQILDKTDRDMCIAIYLHLKSIYDKWILYNRDERNKTITRNIHCDDGSVVKESAKWYEIRAYFPNYIFIDSFYRNIFSILHVNCDILYDLLDNMNENTMVFNFLSQLCTKHHCYFIGLPDFMSLGDANESIAQENLSSMFLPIPYSKKNKLESSNKFLIMFAHPPAHGMSSSKDYRDDTFDIWLENEQTIHPTAQKMFKTDSRSFKQIAIKDADTRDEAQMNRYGYNIPSFGIALNRQNNHIFKDVKISMANPEVTEQSIKAMANILDAQRGNSKRVVFYGQDIYPIYSSYSYTAEVEMAGDAQIMPMMYVQLTNTPLFRGTYLIFKVAHNIAPGNMTTRFSAMRMSRNALPFATGWFTQAAGAFYIDSHGNIIYDTDCNANGASIAHVDYEYISDNVEGWSIDDLIRPGDNPDATIKTCLQDLINNVLGPITKVLGVKPHVTSGYRTPKHNTETGGSPDSQHIYGQAVDLQFVGDRKKTLSIAQAIASSCDFDQLILEYCQSEDASDPRVIHVSYKRPSGTTKNRQAIAFSPNNGGTYKPLSKEQIMKLNLVPNACKVS